MARVILQATATTNPVKVANILYYLLQNKTLHCCYPIISAGAIAVVQIVTRFNIYVSDEFAVVMLHESF